MVKKEQNTARSGRTCSPRKVSSGTFTIECPPRCFLGSANRPRSPGFSTWPNVSISKGGGKKYPSSTTGHYRRTTTVGWLEPEYRLCSSHFYSPRFIIFFTVVDEHNRSLFEVPISWTTDGVFEESKVRDPRVYRDVYESFPFLSSV